MELTKRIIRKLRKIKENIAIDLAYAKKKRQFSVEKPPIFIVGCGHSGTSLLLSILDSHSNIYGIPFESEMAIKEKNMDYFIERFNRRTVVAEKKRWLEKTPKHILYIQKIMNRLPDAKFLIIQRDGRDVAVSIRERHYGFEAGVKRWIDDNKASEPFWDHPNTYLVKYEDIIADFEKTLTGILNFLGEEYEEELRNYHKTPRLLYADFIKKPKSVSGDDHEMNRNWQINQDIFDGRGKWKKKMSDKEKAFFKEKAGDLLIKYRYVKNNDW